MREVSSLRFGPYELDLDDERLWLGTQAVPLTSKALQVLLRLLAQPQQLVTKSDLFAAVWPETTVSDAALTSCIRELRQALQDHAKSPSYIETVHRRGFRFLEPVQTRPIAKELSVLSPAVVSPPPYVVGRQDELEQLHDYLARSLRGERQLVFITGEPGIGKTTLVAGLIDSLVSGEPVWMGQGQCIEHYGSGEAYMPVLGALGRLCRGPQGEQLVAILRRYAPTWLVQMPAFLEPDELEALHLAVAGTTQARMLREMSEALEAITSERPLVLILEDLQWADYSTVELLAALARCQETARLLVLATYRPVDVLVRDHPVHLVQQELQIHGQCQELPLAFLAYEAVGDYLTARFASGESHPSSLQELASFIHSRTEGNPLFMVMLVDALIQQNVLREARGAWVLHGTPADLEIDIPLNLRRLIEQQIERLSAEEREILEAASVAGAVFSAAALTDAVELDTEAVEAVCEGLARRAQFIQSAGISVWPDGTVGGGYGFIHALYQEVAYARVPPGRKVRLHQQIGERLEAGYGEKAAMVAAELGMHFEKGHDYPRAIHYLRQAGSRAAAHSAYHEASGCYERAISVLGQLSETPETLKQGLDLRLDLRNALHPLGEQERVANILHEATAMAERLGDEQRLGHIACYLCIHLLNMDEYDRAITVGKRAVALGASSQAFDVEIVAQSYLGTAYYRVGNFRQALAFSRRVMTQLTDELRFAHYGQVALPSVTSRGLMAWSLAELGEFAEGYPIGEQAIEIAEAIEQPYSTALALSCIGLLACRQGRWHLAIPVLERSVKLCEAANIPHLFPQAASILSSVYTHSERSTEALPLLDQVLERVESESRMLNLGTVFTDLSEALLLVGRVDEVSRVSDRLLKRSPARSSYQAHAYRFLAEVARHQTPHSTNQILSYYQQALTFANELGMRPLQAHCQRALGLLFSDKGQVEQARAALNSALDKYRDMEMVFWVPETERALFQLG